VARTFPEIDDALAAWIAGQALFFVGTAPLDRDGHVNVSPKGPIGTLRIVSPTEVAYLDIVGSGAETAAHVIENGRIVIMLCAFSGRPRIVRLHGRGTVVWAEDPEFDGLRERLRFEEPEVPESRRAIVRVEVTRIADSCGFGVPLMELEGQRSNADAWARGMVAKEGPEALKAYKAAKNESSIDGLPAWAGG
jgi:Pyridoxamine 5'-phosphate oxidase